MSNAHCIHWNSAASAHMTNIDAVLVMQIHFARQCSAVNWLLPDDPIFPHLCSDLMLYMAHNSVKCRSCADSSSIIETIPQVTSLAFLLHSSCWDPHLVRRPEPSIGEGPFKQNMQLTNLGSIGMYNWHILYIFHFCIVCILCILTGDIVHNFSLTFHARLAKYLHLVPAKKRRSKKQLTNAVTIAVRACHQLEFQDIFDLNSIFCIIAYIA